MSVVVLPALFHYIMLGVCFQKSKNQLLRLCSRGCGSPMPF